MPNTITFEKLTARYLDTVKAWWHSERVREFWDNSPEMEADLEGYALRGEKTWYDYYIGFCDGVPHALVMTSEQTPDDYYEYYEPVLSENGKTYALDFMMGNPDYAGRHLGSRTLETFIHEYADLEADRFIIDPEIANTAAYRCYLGAGFTEVGEYTVKDGFFRGKRLRLMIRGR